MGSEMSKEVKANGNPIQVFNKICATNLEIIMSWLDKDKLLSDIKYYCLSFNDEKKPTIKEDEEITYPDNYLAYYWAEFKYDKKDYRVTMFFKDFDYHTGNIHVWPGPFQIWEKGDGNVLFFSEDGEKFKTKELKDEIKLVYKEDSKGKPVHKGSTYIDENGWKPLMKDLAKIKNVIPKDYQERLIPRDHQLSLKGFLEANEKDKDNYFQNCLPMNKLKDEYTKELDAVYYSIYGKDGSRNEIYRCLMYWKTNKKENKINLYYRLVYVEGYGFFNIFDGKKNQFDLNPGGTGMNYYPKHWVINQVSPKDNRDK